jgi:hypothetical protein
MFVGDQIAICVLKFELVRNIVGKVNYLRNFFFFFEKNYLRNLDEQYNTAGQGNLFCKLIKLVHLRKGVNFIFMISFFFKKIKNKKN